MVISMKLHTCAKTLLNLYICRLNRFSMEYIRNLHNLNQSRFSNIQCNQNNFPQLYGINNFSTTKTLLKGKDRGRDKKKVQVMDINPDELDGVINVDRMKLLLDNAFEDYKNQLIKHVSLRTSMGAIEELMIKYDGTEYQLQEIVEISRKPKMIVLNVSAFPQIIPDVLKTLSKSQMNLNPQQEGTVIYIPIPKVTKEHRVNLAKTAKAYFVKCKNEINDVRNKYIKTAKNKEGLSTDLVFRAENYISNVTHDYINNAEQLLQTKEKELLGDSS
ncbi:mitochondrial ribosome recycling factor 1 [Megalopta genalis]|uniref:mitochondrial ribosome recycling factor 1 n=1 Tax=Megalopta genalis TaxID=115081 RepID=UPI003FD2FB38